MARKMKIMPGMYLKALQYSPRNIPVKKGGVVLTVPNDDCQVIVGYDGPGDNTCKWALSEYYTSDEFRKVKKPKELP